MILTQTCHLHISYIFMCKKLWTAEDMYKNINLCDQFLSQPTPYHSHQVVSDIDLVLHYQN